MTSILEDRTGTLWVGTVYGLQQFDRNTESFTLYEHEMENEQSLSHNTVSVLYEDEAGTLWVGTEKGGLNRYDRDTNSFTRFTHYKEDPKSISHNFILLHRGRR